MRLSYYKNKLRREFMKLREMQDGVSCGISLHSEISPLFRRQQEKVEKLYNICMKLEKEK